MKNISCRKCQCKDLFAAVKLIGTSFNHLRRQTGKKLLAKVWRDERNMTHGLSTFAYNEQAIGIYSKFGLAPLCDLPFLQANPGKVKIPESTGLTIIDTLTRADIAWINKLESKIRGYSHPSEWKYWAKSSQHKLYLFKNRGKRIGYSVIANNLQIAPAGAISNDYLLQQMFPCQYHLTNYYSTR